MKVTPEQTEKLLNANLAFSQLGFSMMLTRLKTRYAKSPSPSTLEDCTVEINKFLDKFQTIMGADYAVITKL
jgi:hypothetical protein